MRQPKYRNHIITLSLVSVINMVILLTVIVWHIHSAVVEERKNLIHSQVESALGLANTIFQKSLTSGASSAESEQELFKYIGSMTFQGNGYFWILDRQGVMLAHPNLANLSTKSLIDVQDSEGRFFIRDMLNTADQGGGFVHYEWPKPGDSQPVAKIGYVELFKPWQLVFVSGLYVDDLNKDIMEQFSLGFVTIFVLFVLSILLSLRLSKRYLKEFRHKAIHDSLTLLYSRGHLNDVAPKMFDKAAKTPFSIVFFDLDKFKSINDQLGHKYGDSVLSEASMIIKSALLPHKNVFRYGGEEIVTLLRASEQESFEIAEKVRIAIAEHTFYGPKNTPFHITVSAGIAEKKAGDNVVELLKRADLCMYIAKERGRNQVVVDSDVRKTDRD
ncbi:diguanylate cyclase [Marinomonas sp.]